jgi:hypothetical protein
MCPQVENFDTHRAHPAPASATHAPPTKRGRETFSLLVNLGAVCVPKNYVHTNQLEYCRSACAKDPEHFDLFDIRITDTQCAHPSRTLQPDERFNVFVYMQQTYGVTTVEERMNFIVSQGGVFLNVQGASLVLMQKHLLLPRGFWYTSYDVRQHLMVGKNSARYVPHLYVDDDGRASILVTNVEERLNKYYAMLVFVEE